MAYKLSRINGKEDSKRLKNKKKLKKIRENWRDPSKRKAQKLKQHFQEISTL